MSRCRRKLPRNLVKQIPAKFKCIPPYPRSFCQLDDLAEGQYLRQLARVGPLALVQQLLSPTLDSGADIVASQEGRQGRSLGLADFDAQRAAIAFVAAYFGSASNLVGLFDLSILNGLQECSNWHLV